MTRTPTDITKKTPLSRLIFRDLLAAIERVLYQENAGIEVPAGKLKRLYQQLDEALANVRKGPRSLHHMTNSFKKEEKP